MSKKAKIIIGVVVAFLIIGALTNAGKDNEEEAQAPPAPRQEENQQEPEEEQTEPTTIEGRVEAIILDVLGEETNMGLHRIEELKINDHLGVEREGAKIILATLNGDDNFSTGMIRSGMLLSTKRVMERFFALGETEEAAIFWQFTLVDQYGNEDLENVMKVTLDRVTANKINWENVLTDNIPAIATDYWEHPAFSN